MKIAIFRLLQKHQSLDEKLRLEQSKRWPSHTRIRQLKKLKLAVKDALAANTPITIQGAHSLRGPVGGGACQAAAVAFGRGERA